MKLVFFFGGMLFPKLADYGMLLDGAWSKLELAPGGILAVMELYGSMYPKHVRVFRDTMLRESGLDSRSIQELSLIEKPWNWKCSENTKL